MSEPDFIEAPLMGADQSPAKTIYPPTAMAPLAPMFRAPDAVPELYLPVLPSALFLL